MKLSAEDLSCVLNDRVKIVGDRSSRAADKPTLWWTWHC